MSSTLSVQSRLKLNGKIMRIPFLLQTREYATPTSMTNDDKREKVVVLGSGWAGMPSIYDRSDELALVADYVLFP